MEWWLALTAQYMLADLISLEFTPTLREDSGGFLEEAALGSDLRGRRISSSHCEHDGKVERAFLRTGTV